MRAAAHAYFLRHRGSHESVHVRSNLSEIGRNFYHWRKVSVCDDAYALARLWSSKFRSDLDLQEQMAITDAFEDFAQATEFFFTPLEKSVQFYWEHRMGTWHAQVCSESDVALDSASLYNCRKIIEAFLSVPIELQLAGVIHRDIILRAWPELAEYPINGKPF